MITLTKPQRQALARVHQRIVADFARNHPSNAENMQAAPTYREVRQRVHPGPGCVLVQYAGMWLGIEPDGYTHS